ncbi:hypothetical protein LXL04_003564 [Taraxacum kok-saghyz]
MKGRAPFTLSTFRKRGQKSRDQGDMHFVIRHTNNGGGLIKRSVAAKKRVVALDDNPKHEQAAATKLLRRLEALSAVSLLPDNKDNTRGRNPEIEFWNKITPLHCNEDPSLMEIERAFIDDIVAEASIWYTYERLHFNFNIPTSSDSSEYVEKILEVDPNDQEVNSPVLTVPESGADTLKPNPDWVLDSESSSATREKLSPKKTSPSQQTSTSDPPITKEEFNHLNNKVDRILGILQQKSPLPSVADREKQLDSLISICLQDSLTKVDNTYTAFEAKCLLQSAYAFDHVNDSRIKYSQQLQEFKQREAVRAARKVDEEVKKWIKEFAFLDDEEKVLKKKTSDGDSGLKVRKDDPHISEDEQLRRAILNNLRDQEQSDFSQGPSPVSRWNPEARIETFHLVPVKTYEERARLEAFFNKFAQPIKTICSLPCIKGVSNIKAKAFTTKKKKAKFYVFEIRRAGNTTITIFEADFPFMNHVDILILARHLDKLREKNHQMDRPYLALSTFLKDYLCKFGRLEVDLHMLYKDTPAPPNKPNNSKEIQDFPSGVLSTPKPGFIYHLRNTREKRYFKVSEKHLYPSIFLAKVITKPKFMAGPLKVANGIKEIINWWIAVCNWMRTAIVWSLKPPTNLEDPGNLCHLGGDC